MVYYAGTNGFAPNVYINLDSVLLEWSWVAPNLNGGSNTYYLYVQDNLTSMPDPSVIWDFQPNVEFFLLTYIPTNYSVGEATFSQANGATPVGTLTIPLDMLGPNYASNTWTAYEALLPATTVVLSDVAGRDVTNTPGRLEIKLERDARSGIGKHQLAELPPAERDQPVFGQQPRQDYVTVFGHQPAESDWLADHHQLAAAKRFAAGRLNQPL